jgi:predicted kinase
MLIAIMGLPGSGKSYFASHLARNLDIPHLSSDKIREERSLKGRYGEEEKLKVYQELIREALQALRRHQHVIIDASFSRKKYRQMARESAASQKVALHFVEMTAREEDIRQRVSQSRKYTEADFDIYRKMKENFERLDEAHLQLNSSEKNIDQLIQVSRNYLNL